MADGDPKRDIAQLIVSVVPLLERRSSWSARELSDLFDTVQKEGFEAATGMAKTGEGIAPPNPSGCGELKQNEAA